MAGNGIKLKIFSWKFSFWNLFWVFHPIFIKFMHFLKGFQSKNNVFGLIFDYTLTESLVILWIHNLLQNIFDSYGINDFSFPIQWNQQKSVFSKSEIVYSLRPIPLRICCVSPPSHHRAEYSWLLCSSMTTNFISLRNKLVFNQSRFVRVIYSVSLSCSVLSLIISRTHCHSYSLNCLTCHLLCPLVDVSLSIRHCPRLRIPCVSSRCLFFALHPF